MKTNETTDPMVVTREQLLQSHLPVSRRTLFDLRRRGLPYIQIGRRILFHLPSVEAYLMRHQRGEAVAVAPMNSADGGLTVLANERR